jgi:hypothetical protein
MSVFCDRLKLGSTKADIAKKSSYSYSCCWGEPTKIPHPPQNEGAVAQQGRDPLGETPKFNVVNFEWELLLSLVTIKTWWRGIFQRL